MKSFITCTLYHVINSRMMRWAGHVTCMGEMRSARTVWLESLKVRDHSEELGVNGRIILE
jgi:hypothetical protein